MRVTYPADSSGIEPHVAHHVVCLNRAVLAIAKYRQTVDPNSLEVPAPHKVDYDEPFLKRQLASRN